MGNYICLGRLSHIVACSHSFIKYTYDVTIISCDSRAKNIEKSMSEPRVYGVRTQIRGVCRRRNTRCVYYKWARCTACWCGVASGECDGRWSADLSRRVRRACAAADGGWLFARLSRVDDNVICTRRNVARTPQPRVHVPHMSLARRSGGTCGHGMRTLGSQVVRLADNDVRVVVAGPPGRRRRVVRRPGGARWRRPLPRRWCVRALQRLRRRGISRPPYYQSNAGNSAGGGDDDALVRRLHGVCSAVHVHIFTVVPFISCPNKIKTRKLR